MAKLLTKNSYSKSPRELFDALEETYFFGRQGKKHSEIRPYFLITDGSDVIVFDNGSKRSCGVSLSFEKRPTLFTARFWNRNPRNFSAMVKKFINAALETIIDVADEERERFFSRITIIETLNALYSLDRKHVLPIYIVKLPHDEPIKFNVKLPGDISTMYVDDFIGKSVLGLAQFDAISRAIAYLIGSNQVAFPRADDLHMEDD